MRRADFSPQYTQVQIQFFITGIVKIKGGDKDERDKLNSSCVSSQ